ncbi:hypothetical protein IMCC21224_113531 [Puniceibacterium sp. IMCC21224]|nr:hypothetical protein IMCC21224_113531 [Puniceibacterium sp. IMCC21224]
MGPDPKMLILRISGNSTVSTQVYALGVVARGVNSRENRRQEETCSRRMDAVSEIIR